MNAHQSDGWGSTVTTSFVQTIGNKKFRRFGRFRHEFLLERGIIKYHEGDQIVMEMKMAPRRLLHGKKAWHIFIAATEFHPSLYELGHKHIDLGLLAGRTASFSHFANDGGQALISEWVVCLYIVLTFVFTCTHIFEVGCQTGRP